MSATNFSRGPWVATLERHTYPESDDADLPCIVHDADGHEVVYVQERYRDGYSYEADAHLIAAAPDLYSAVVALIGHSGYAAEGVSDDYEFLVAVKAKDFRAARAALAKARGEQ